MWKPPIAAMVAVSASGQLISGQGSAPNPFSKAPANVNDALTSRVSEFYQDHVTGKYRKAEALVAEESKDGFYAANKPALESFKIGDITYSDNYQKAKVLIVGKMFMSFMGLSGPQLMDVPFPSYWKVEGGKWAWYIFQDPNRMTPFGKSNGTSGAASTDPTAAFASAPNLAAIQSGVKADRTEVRFPKSAGAKEVVTLTNQLQGPVTVSLDLQSYPGMSATLEPKEIKAGQKAALTLETAVAKVYANRIVRVVVKPSNQLIDIIVKFQ